MLVITDETQTTAISNLPLRQLVEQRINERNEYCSEDPDELGPIIVPEPGDTSDDLKQITGFSIIEGPFDDSRFGDENFAPSFEFAESHGDFYDIVSSKICCIKVCFDDSIKKLSA